MSNAVFPALPGRAWPIKRSARWKNTRKETDSGRDFVHIGWTAPKWRYTIPHEVLRQGQGLTEFAQLAGFFNRHYGGGDSWLFDDLDDNAVTAQQFGTGNGSTTQYQLVRALDGVLEPVYEPKAGAQFFVNGYPAGTNFLSGGNFEADSNADGLANNWQAFYGGTTGTRSYAVSAPGGQIGGFSQHVEASGLGASSSDYVGIKQLGVPVVSLAGGSYCFSIYTQPSTGPALRYYIEWRDGSSVYISSSGSLFTLSAGWQRYQDTGTVPANAVTADVYVWIEANAAGPGVAAANFDGAQLVPGTVPTDFVSSDLKPTIGANGLVTFNYPPPAASVLTWTGGYYWRCLFDTDECDFEKFMEGLWSQRGLSFTTKKPV